jgi:hypothetical protein
MRTAFEKGNHRHARRLSWQSLAGVPERTLDRLSPEPLAFVERTV